MARQQRCQPRSATQSQASIAMKSSKNAVATRPVADFTPRHVAIIPDGNRRWARSRGLHVREGHERCFLEVTPTIISHLWSRGVAEVTVWLLSTENTSRRSSQEISDLMDVYVTMFDLVSQLATDFGAIVTHAGRLDRVRPDVERGLRALVERQTRYQGRILNLALDYGGADSLVRVMRDLIAAGIDPASIDEAMLRTALRPSQHPHVDPDLVIRTSGEHRLSGFMPLESCYAEYHFPMVFYPDFTTELADEALQSYGHRHRRFGN